MGETILWADYSRKWHGACWKCLHPVATAPSTPAKLPPLPTLLVSRDSVDLGRAMVLLCAVVLLRGKHLLLWESRKMRSDACAFQPLARTVHASDRSSGERGWVLQTNTWPAAQGRAEHGTSTVVTDAWYLCLWVILVSLGAAHNGKSWFHCVSGMLSIISVQSFSANYFRVLIP